MLEIQNLHTEVAGEEVLKGIDLKIKAGETHAIMGPNGSGKSTLSKVIAGLPGYGVTAGSLHYQIGLKKKDLTELEIDERAREGIFLSYQYPVEVPGVNNYEFLRSAFNAVSGHQGAEEMDTIEFEEFAQKKLESVGLKPQFFDRELNVGLSGGEKKKNEIMQMALLSPRLCMLDELDSGLDVDSLKHLAGVINKMRSKNNAFLLITHYQRLLELIQPDVVHIMVNGRLERTGGIEVAQDVETRGYDWLH